MIALAVAVLLGLLSLDAAADVVWSQPHDGTGTVLQSSGNGMDYDRFVWDDFTLPADQDVTDMQWRGGYDPQIPPIYPSGPIQYFDVTIWGTIAGQPDIGAGPLVLYEMVPNNETPAGTFGGAPLYDYSFSLAASPFTPFHAVGGVKYWVRIGAFQPGVPGWGLAMGTGGDTVLFESFVNYAGGTQYRFGTGDVALTLSGPAGTTSTTLLPSTTSTTATSTTSTTVSTTLPPPLACGAAARTGCLTPGKVSLLVNEKVHGKEKLALTLAKLTEATTRAAFGDPVTGTTSYAVCIYGQNGALADQLRVDRAGAPCGKKPCWSANAAGYKYSDPSTSADGVRLVTCKAGAPGKGQVVAKGMNVASKGQTSLPTGIAAALAGNTQATVQVLTSDARCVGATLTHVTKSDGVQFKATAP